MLDKDISGIKTRVEDMVRQINFARQEKESSEGFVAEFSERIEKLQESIAQGKQEKQTLVKERNDLQALAKECEEKGNALTAELEDVSATLQDAGDARRATR